MRRRALISLLGGKCVKCNVNKRLHFDHIDPTTKLFEINEILDCKLDKLLDEIKKCQLLCISCHGKKTRVEQGFGGYKHGMYSMYQNLRCRCNECRAANATYKREYMKNYRKNKKLVTQGI